MRHVSEVYEAYGVCDGYEALKANEACEAFV